jgi:glyoxylase-like metal-dependent hydrolase (beta-lactamase superfamily II)
MSQRVCKTNSYRCEAAQLDDINPNKEVSMLRKRTINSGLVFALILGPVVLSARSRSNIRADSNLSNESRQTQEAESPARNFDVQKLAEGVYAVIRQDPPGLMVDANNVFIINDDDVVVIDSNGAPLITKEVLAALRKLTNKPVKYVINTHWHDDHIRGNQVYRDAFPAVEFIGHPSTREYLPNQGAINRKQFLEGAPKFLDVIKESMEKNKSLTGSDLSPEERTSYMSDVRLAEFVLRDGAAAQTILPTITVADRLTIYRGARQIQIQHLGAGHTAADLVVHLPIEGILITGDLVVWPVPLVGDPQSHIGAWAVTLEKLCGLKATKIVPGHGPVLHDMSYLKTLAAMFTSISVQTAAAISRGETPEQARKSVKLDEFRKQLAGDSPVRRVLFSNYVAYPAVGVAFREASKK